MHYDIQRFGLTGTMAYDTFNKTKQELVKDVEDGMRDEGFVPVLDLPDVFTRSYDCDTETFDFEISIYGTYVGEEEAWRIAGMTIHGTTVERSTVPNK